MKITLIEPFFTGSHASWAEELARYSRHDITILSLSGHHWKWRMHGGAVTLARQYAEKGIESDLILATDMLDLTTFQSLTRKLTADVPAALYMHENQLSYYWSPKDRDLAKNRDNHYGFINYASTLAADAVLFNSQFHLTDYFEQLPNFLGQFPDRNETGTIDAIKAKSRVLPLGLDLKRLNDMQIIGRRYWDEKKPLILWNHRWEYDKNPEAFAQAMRQLVEENYDFLIAVTGESPERRPKVFTDLNRDLGERVVQFGHVESFEEYAKWLWRADILPVTSYHDFFGVSVVQALNCNCHPLLPERLAYPEHLPVSEHERFFYKYEHQLVPRLKALLDNIHDTRRIKTQEYVLKYDWYYTIEQYDKMFDGIIEQAATSTPLFQ